MTSTNTSNTNTNETEGRALVALTLWLAQELDWNRLQEELDSTGLSKERVGELARQAQGL